MLILLKGPAGPVMGVAFPNSQKQSAVQTGLSLLNISVDTLRPERFEAMTRRRGHDRVMGAIKRAVELGFDPVKVCPAWKRVL